VIVLITTAGHMKTHWPCRQWTSVKVTVLPYHRALSSPRLPRATYIFADVDRLGFWELELSAKLYRVLRAAGVRTLNDPALVRQRFSLLRALQREGRNDFQVYRVEADESPRRFPVFLRSESAHRGTLSSLLHTQAEVDAAVTSAVSNGIPRKELLLLEYCAEPIADDVFRKLSVYRVGPRMVPTLAVHQSTWHAKAGELGIADAATYEDEYASVSANRYGDMLRPCFDIARIGYGRADFGFVGGKPQVYEINTNPYLKSVKSHPYPIRVEAARLSMKLLEEAFAEIDTDATSGTVAVDDELLVRQRRLDRWSFGPRWTP
jgi:hypothetical protein